MADKKISELVSLTGANAATGDLLPIVDISATETKKITRDEFFKSIPSIDINGGTIDGTVIGGSTPAAISGTTGSFSGDVNIADKIVHTGDTNTAIRFPAADTVTVETAGSERVRVDLGGSVGIGTNAPDSRLHVVSGSVNGLRIGFGGVASNYYDADTHFFRSGAGTERMRITSTGNVGIGTSSPAEELHISAPNAAFRIDNNGAEEYSILTAFPAAGDIYHQYFNRSGGVYTNSVSRALTHQFRSSAGSEVMRIDSSGRLLVGSTTAAAGLASGTLQVGSGHSGITNTGSLIAPSIISSGSLEFNFDGVSGTQRHGRITGNGTTAGGAYAGGLDFEYYAFDGANYRWYTGARIDSSGNVGIGNTAPASRLHVTDSSTATTTGISTCVGLTLQNSSSTDGNYTSIQNRDASGDQNAEIKFINVSQANQQGAIAFTTRSSVGEFAEKMRIDSSGNVGIGTSSPSTRFEANTGASGTQDIATVRSSNVQLKIGTTDVGNGQVTYNAFPTSNPSASTEHIWQSGGTEIMRLDTSRNLLSGCTSLPSASVKGSAFLNDANQGRLYVAANNTGARDLAYWINPNGVVGTITTTGSSTAYNTSSDYRLKENVVQLTGAADRLAQIPVHRFNFIADPDRTVDGFLAHEVQAFVPEAVTGEKDAVDADGNPEYQGIDQSKLVPLLTAALQEALTEIADLKARVTALEAQP